MIRFTHKKHHKLYTYVRAGLRIGQTAFAIEKPLVGNEEEIIRQIHTIRYNASNPYVITGGHFYQLFVRNLGIFFNALVDPRILSTHADWEMRQAIALKTVAFDLEMFDQAQEEYTTITPVTKTLFTGLNLYARPSDSLHAIVYTLRALSDENFIPSLFPTKGIARKSLTTKNNVKKLLKTYTITLKKLLKNYHIELIDSTTGIIKKELLLASARDGIKRQSAFYDNVILWATVRHAKELGLYTISDKEISDWKELLIKTFWDEKEGIFLDDLSAYTKKKKLFSADSFIVTSTGFFDWNNKKDMHYLQKMVMYVKKKKLDQPFPLHYSTIDQPQNLYRPVRYFAPSYMGTSIWSHWGMEYIKALLYLAKDDTSLLQDAKKHMEHYKQNIAQYGGYPEVYGADGSILSTRLYRSVLHNGWVINYEQTKMLLYYFSHKPYPIHSSTSV